MPNVFTNHGSLIVVFCKSVNANTVVKLIEITSKITNNTILLFNTIF